MTEILTYTLILCGLGVLGFNAAVVLHAAQIVHQVFAWRIFIVGKSLMTLYVLVSLHANLSHPHTWAVGLAGVAIMLTLISLVLLDHSYRQNHPQRPART